MLLNAEKKNTQHSPHFNTCLKFSYNVLIPSEIKISVHGDSTTFLISDVRIGDTPSDRNQFMKPDLTSYEIIGPSTLINMKKK
jgi:hypothetical protein